jgi:hypothetical protein
MNCKHVQELLPLYVARDLEDKRAKLVTAHVKSCAKCAKSADEYHETRQLLQQFAPPPFSEAVYAGIRQRVLREIRPESTAPALTQLIASLFRPRIRWAVATALLLAVAMFGFYFISNRSNDRQQVAGNGRTVDQAKQDKQPNPQLQGEESAASPSSTSKGSDGPSGTSTGRNTGSDATIAGSGAHQLLRRKRFGAAPDQPRPIAVNTPDTRSMTAKGSPDGNNLAEPEAVPTYDPAASEKTLRVEMQTKDPNVRIIWFSHQRTKQDYPSSKGI